MHVPIKVDYAVRALVDLAQHVDSGPERAAAVAQRQGIPEAYLERLLSTLNKQGIVSSQRGPQGGHVLGQDAADIDLRSVMEALGDTVSTVSCIDDPGCCRYRVSRNTILPPLQHRNHLTMSLSTGRDSTGFSGCRIQGCSHPSRLRSG